MQSGPGKKIARFCADIEAVRGLPDRRLQLILADIHPENSSATIHGKALWTWDLAPDKPQPLPGQTVCLTRSILPLHGFYNEAVSLHEVSRRAEGIFWRVWSRENKGEPQFSGKPKIWAAWRAALRQKLLALLENPADHPERISEAGALLPALLFGDRFYLRQQTTENFALAAIAHSLALSGQHLALAGLLGIFCITAAALFQPAIYLWRPRPVLVAVSSCPAAMLYLWIGNAPPSLLRAACMMFVLCFLVVRSRAFSGQDVVFFAVVIFLLSAPLSFLEIGTQLSFFCVLAIALFLPGLKQLWPFYTDRTHHATFGKRICQILIISLIIQAALLPLTLKYFGLAGLWFPINVLWLPVLGLVVLPCAALGLFFASLPFEASEWLAKMLLNIALMPCRLLCDGLEYMRHWQILTEPVFLRPHWSALAAFALLMIGLAASIGKTKVGPAWKKKVFVLALVFLAVGPCLRLWDVLEGKIVIDILDMGQGQAICLHLPGGKRLVLDGGGSSSKRFEPGKALLAPALVDNAAPRLAAIVNSHPDLDHMGGLLYLLDHFETGPLFHNGREASGAQKDLWAAAVDIQAARALVRGDRLELGNDLYLEVLHPPAGEDRWTDNNASVILRLCRGWEGLALIPGDAEVESLRAVLASGVDVRARVLIAPHHGSNSSYLPEFFKSVDPEIIVAACGFRNRYSYPGRKLRGWAERNRVPLLNTGEHGRIRILPEGGLRIHTNLPASAVLSAKSQAGQAYRQ